MSSTLIWSHLLFRSEFWLDVLHAYLNFSSNFLQNTSKLTLTFSSKSKQTQNIFVFQTKIWLSLWNNPCRILLPFADEKSWKNTKCNSFLFWNFQLEFWRWHRNSLKITWLEFFKNFRSEFWLLNQMASAIAFTLLQRHFRSIEFSRGNISTFKKNVD